MEIGWFSFVSIVVSSQPISCFSRLCRLAVSYVDQSLSLTWDPRLHTDVHWQKWFRHALCSIVLAHDHEAFCGSSIAHTHWPHKSWFPVPRVQTSRASCRRMGNLLRNPLILTPMAVPRVLKGCRRTCQGPCILCARVSKKNIPWKVHLIPFNPVYEMLEPPFRSFQADRQP